MNNQEQIAQRVMKLEESAGFQDRATELLSGEIAVLNRRVAELQGHLLRLESRLSKLLEPAEAEDPPE